MTLPLAVALFFAATLGADAALPEKSKEKVEPDKFDQAVAISGECIKLVHAGNPVGGCKNVLVNMNYSTGVSAYWFVTDRTILSFTGDGSRRIEQGSGIVTQSIEKIIVATMEKDSKMDETKEEDAVGFCRHLRSSSRWAEGQMQRQRQVRPFYSRGRAHAPPCFGFDPRLTPVAREPLGRARVSTFRRNLPRPLPHDHDLGADVHALEQVGDVLVEHANAAIGSELADRLRPVRAVDGVLATRERHGRNPHRVVGRATRDHIGQRRVIRFHFGRRRPGGLDELAADPSLTLPLLAGATHRHRVADRLAAPEHEIEFPLGRLDHDGAGLVLSGVAHHLAGASRGG